MGRNDEYEYVGQHGPVDVVNPEGEGAQSDLTEAVLRPPRRPATDSLSGDRMRGNVGRPLVVIPGGPKKALLNVMWEDELARIVTVFLAQPYAQSAQAQANPPYPLAAVALVQWGAGGVETQAEIDVGQGVVFTLPCSYLRIYGRIDAVAASTAPAIDGLTLQASLSVGTSNRETALTRTFYDNAGIGVGGASLGFLVPPFAKSVLVLLGDDLTRHISVDVFGLVLVTPIYTVTFLAGQRVFEIPLAADAFNVRINNLGPATGPIRVVFGLGI